MFSESSEAGASDLLERKHVFHFIKVIHFLHTFISYKSNVNLFLIFLPVLSSVEYYDISLNEWTDAPSMNSKSVTPGVVSVNG